MESKENSTPSLKRKPEPEPVDFEDSIKPKPLNSMNQSKLSEFTNDSESEKFYTPPEYESKEVPSKNTTNASEENPNKQTVSEEKPIIEDSKSVLQETPLVSGKTEEPSCKTQEIKEPSPKTLSSTESLSDSQPLHPESQKIEIKQAPIEEGPISSVSNTLLDEAKTSSEENPKINK